MECEKCSCEIKQSEKQYDPFSNSPRSGGCAKCYYASSSYNASPCKECIEEETTTDKFPRFKKALVTVPR